MAVKINRDAQMTRDKILEAAIVEFSDKGLKGARISGIAKRAKTNYQALYYHFGNKEKLYAAALESVITQGGELHGFDIPVEKIGAEAAMSQLIDGIFNAYYHNIRYINLLADENVHKARHYDQMPVAKQLYDEVLETTAKILRAGERQGVLRAGLDPVLVYVTIAGLAGSYMSNVPLNSKSFERKFDSTEEVENWRGFVKATLLSGFCVSPAQ